MKNKQDYFQFLKNVYFFSNLTDDEIQMLLQVCHEQKYEPQDVIFEEGDRAYKFFIIISGEVEVWKDYNTEHKDILAEHGKGHLFGEMALVDDLPRSATVVAKTSTRLLYIDGEDFQKIIKANSSIAVSVMKSISSMVRKSNESYIENLRKRNKELEKAYQELKEAQDELLRMERLSMLGKFSSLIIHDIKNPISILTGYAKMIMMNSTSNEKIKKQANIIIQESLRLNSMANELLDYSRGEIRLNLKIVNLKELIKQVVKSIEEKFSVRNIKIISDIKYEGPVLIDMDRMLRIFFNLSDNAYKAMPRGGKFSISIYEKKKFYVIKILDTGAGMNENVKKRIFEPFFSYSERGGTGLGMSIVKNIIEAHHGHINFASIKNKGTCFVIKMPKYN